MMHLFLLLLLQSAPALTVDEIMARVAENQDRAQEARKQWVFEQDVLVRLHRTNGKLAREETRKYLVTPTPTGLQRKLQSQEGGEHKDGLDLDGDLVQSFAEDEDLNIGDKNKDGVSKEMFPLTAKEQSKYIYKLEGREDYRGSSVYRVSFRPKPKTEDADWKGEALIDAAEFEPVLVTTALGVNIPFLVKRCLAPTSNISGLKSPTKKSRTVSGSPPPTAASFTFEDCSSTSATYPSR